MPADGDKLRVCIHVRLAGSLCYTTEVGRLIQSISLAMKVVGLEHSHHTLLGPWLLYFWTYSVLPSCRESGETPPANEIKSR